MTPNEQYWEILLARTAKALDDNKFGVSVHQTASDAAAYLVDTMLTKEWQGKVNFGGSYSVSQSGVVDLLKTIPGADIVPTHDHTVPREAIAALRREHFICDLYLCSSNAVTTQGQLLNVDGTGNRVASMIYGPAKVVLFVGRNKICESLDVAIDRERNIASPINCMRLDLPNPCVKTGRCMDCRSPRRICNYRVLTERCHPEKRIHVLLINEDLGF
ncbi:MAG: hypothetical protein DELT_01660 [Desulfovibrio sp.]